jgi:hypothetical protein
VQSKLKQLLTGWVKDKILSYINKHLKSINELIKFSLGNIEPFCWKSPWLLWSCMQKNDKRVAPYVKRIIDKLENCKDNQQRELMLVLYRMEIKDEYISLYSIPASESGSVLKKSLRFDIALFN